MFVHLVVVLYTCTFLLFPQIYIGHDNPCKDYCRNGAVCVMTDINTDPYCYCPDGWTGPQCDQHVPSCDYYCKNGGSCTIINHMPYCRCLPTHEGMRCEHTKSRIESSSKEEETSYALPIVLSVGVILLIAGALIVVVYVLRGRESFSHERLQENDFNNPMYQDRDAEPFTLDADKVSMIEML